MKKRSIIGIALSNLLGIVIFLVGLYLANWVAGRIGGPFEGFVNVVNQNVLLLITISIIFMVSEMFSSFEFPFNISYPMFSALATIFLLIFFFSVLKYLDLSFGLPIFKPLIAFSSVIYMLVAIFVLIGNYISMLAKASKEEKGEVKEEKNVSWEEVGENFKTALSYLFSKLSGKTIPVQKKDKKRKKEDSD